KKKKKKKNLRERKKRKSSRCVFSSPVKARRRRICEGRVYKISLLVIGVLRAHRCLSLWWFSSRVMGFGGASVFGGFDLVDG
ncbi:unnamed protein product, partial [Arabidopsis halleri]